MVILEKSVDGPGSCRLARDGRSRSRCSVVARLGYSTCRASRQSFVSPSVVLGKGFLIPSIRFSF